MTKSRMKKIVIIALIVALLAPFAYRRARKIVFAAYAANMPRETLFPASEQPDQIRLTWSCDPASTKTIQWRTALDVDGHAAQFHKKGDGNMKTAPASVITISDSRLVNDPEALRAVVTLEDLEPSTTYAYRVGSETGGAWSEWLSFNTAPQTAEPFSFLYFGDVQTGFTIWTSLLDAANEISPEAAFCLVAGDLVNRGNWRNEWDEFFDAGSDFLKTRPIVPAIGNHECPHGQDPWLYLDTFKLPQNGPEGIEHGRAYSFRYSNALFIILDSNLTPASQRTWLEHKLSTSNDTWKFVMYHHPAYSARTRRDNPQVRAQWCDLFDKYGVDIAFQGHDHAYKRTKPMRANEIAESTDNGVIYIVSVAGDKMYEPGEFDYAPMTLADTPTWQVIDIETGEADRLNYRAYDLEGNLVDEFTIEK